MIEQFVNKNFRQDTLDRLIRQAIEPYVDREEWDRVEAREAQRKAYLSSIAVKSEKDV